MERVRKLVTPLRFVVLHALALHFSKWKDERTRVNTCVNKSLVQALESCPSSDANHSTLSRENSKLAGLANAYMDSQKLDAILREPCNMARGVL